MSTGLLSQLDTYYSWIDEAQNPIHPDEVASLIDTPARELAVPVPAWSSPTFHFLGRTRATTSTP